MRCVDCGGAAAAWQVGCGRFVFEQSFEHSIWPARHSERPGKDYNRRGGGFHADRSDALVARSNRFSVCVAINGR
jgi:hypothetical protein